jgi:hypothetical protein
MLQQCDTTRAKLVTPHKLNPSGRRREVIKKIRGKPQLDGSVHKEAGMFNVKSKKCTRRRLNPMTRQQEVFPNCKRINVESYIHTLSPDGSQVRGSTKNQIRLVLCQDVSKNTGQCHTGRVLGQG